MADDKGTTDTGRKREGGDGGVTTGMKRGDPTTVVDVGVLDEKGRRIDPKSAKAVHRDAQATVAKPETGEVETGIMGADDPDTADLDAAEREAAASAGANADEGAEGAAAEVVEDLGDYDPENAETVAKFDAVYANEDGSPNLDRFTQEWEKSLADAEGDATKAGISKGGREWAKKTYGVTDAQVDQIIAGQVSLRSEAAESLFKGVPGGKPTVDAAKDWAKKGGYSKDQIARFNKIMDGKDNDAVQDAVAALVGRYTAATGKVPASRRASVRRPGGADTTVRNVTEGAGTKPAASGAPAFASGAEQNTAFKEARAKDIAEGGEKHVAAWRERVRATIRSHKK